MGGSVGGQGTCKLTGAVFFRNLNIFSIIIRSIHQILFLTGITG